MNKALLAHLNDAERRLIQLTEPKELVKLDEEAAIDLQDKVRRARNKARGQYRRPASKTVATAGGRGKARDGGNKNALRVEAFEEALSRVSHRVSVLSRQSAKELKAERIAAAQAAKQGQKPAAKGTVKTAARKAPAKKAAPKRAKASTRTPSATKNRADLAARGTRRQAKRDAR